MNEIPRSETIRLPDLFYQVAAALPPGPSVYLVGGAVRDALVGHEVHDLDFTLPQDVFSVARHVARKVGASFFPLDEERETARLVLSLPGDERRIIDFSGFRGPDLDSDLRGRDFTVNAIAIDARRPLDLIDPLNGENELKRKVLRTCSPTSFTDDPVRILRAVRLSLEYNFQIEPDTRRLMREALDDLHEVSVERLRDELVKILEGTQPATGLRALDVLGAYPLLWPELLSLKGVEQSAPHYQDVWDHTFSVIQKLGDVLAALAHDYDPDSAANLSLGLMVLRLGRYRESLYQHFQTRLVPDRNLRGLLFLAALFHDAGKPDTGQKDEDGRIRFFQHDQVGAELAAHRAAQLRLSNSEIDRLRAIVRFHIRPLLLSKSDQLPSGKAIYRYFRDTGPAGVDIGLLSLADFLATHGTTFDSQEWVHHLDVVRVLFESWFEHPHESVTPPVLVTGHDLIEHFSLQPGPQIGDLLESVREAQASGLVRNSEDALQLVKELLKN